MNIFSFFKLFGGLAFFLFGMAHMSGALEKMAGGKLERMLKKATSNKYKALVFGAVITIAIQSSSAFTVMLVGFVNSGIMELGQTIGAIMGSNIGTTLTAWILSLAGISSNNILLSLIKPENLAPIIAFIGVIIVMISKNPKQKNIGNLMVGFSILMTGMNFMSDSMKPFSDMPEFKDIMVAFKNPVVGVLVGAIITGAIQSSAASVGMLQALSMTGQVTYGMAIPIIMGQNIGTCVTAVLSSFGVNRAAKRVSVVHILFNVIGTVFWLIISYILHAIFRFSFIEDTIDPVGIAFSHTIFNIATTFLLFPFTKQLENMAKFFINVGEGEQARVFLDERLMATPGVALEELTHAMNSMAIKTRDGLDRAMLLLQEFNHRDYDFILENESNIDKMQDNIGSYVTKLSTLGHLSEKSKKKANAILQSVNEFERLADYAHYLADSAKEIYDKKLEFSTEYEVELKKLIDAMSECYNMAINSYLKKDTEEAKKVIPLNSVMEDLVEYEKELHVDRMNSGICKMTQGFVFNDVLTSAARIAGHSANIAVSMIRVDSNKIGKGYMHDLKHRYNEKYSILYDKYYEKYIGKQSV